MLTWSARLGLGRAQTSSRTYRVGYLGYTEANPPGVADVWPAFVQRLGELGFVEGRNLALLSRYAEGHNERYTDFANEFARLRVDLVVVASGPAARAVMTASPTIPIVTVAVGDPVRAGLVASLARPGGRVTGISNLADDLTLKRMELLKAAVPSARKMAFARCPGCALSAGESAEQVDVRYAQYAAATRALGMELLPLDVNSASDFLAARAIVQRERPDALLIGATPVNVALNTEWLALAAEQRLPTMAPYRGFGAMLSFGPDIVAIYRRAAEFVALILNGANPAETPMEQPTRFELVVND
ncbi:MAG: ABC transporter substrate-binding protein [Proteobacteria bacterium]|nr:ABC transporter substrate-binding protein [Pseudomonadota bacterium]